VPPPAKPRRASRSEQTEARIARREAAVPKITYPPQLPVSARKDELLEAIRDHQVVVVAGATGSGKTTQLPKICLELGRGIRGTIAHTQPRRLAARTVAQRIADELDVPLGGAVGYAVRFNDQSGEDTLVRLVTDGLLLAEIQRDPLLKRYDTIIVDEAHERSLNIDFLLGCIKRILPRRPDLKLIITSATIDPQRFSTHFGDAPIVEVSGRTYPVEIRYQPVVDPDGEGEQAERDQTDAIGDAVDELLREHPGNPGDVLVFLSGEREIRDTADALNGRFKTGVDVLPLYARLSTAEQQRVFETGKRTKRRVVLATNVAETSLTVPGIRYVVDPGTARISRYSARLKVQRLPIEKISQASADQRAGRCGRTSDGICIRLYAEDDFAERPRFTEPEILRTSLASVILQMAALGLGEIEQFPFLDPPDSRQVRDGIALLHELGALDRHADAGKRLTKLGRRLAQLPVDPRMGRMVLEADQLSCADEVIIIAAALSIQDPRERPADKQQAADEQHARFADEHSDFTAYLNLWRYLRAQKSELSGNQFRKQCKREYLHYLRIREWQDLASQLRQAARRAGVTINQEPGDDQHIHVALLSGLLSHVGLKDQSRREYLGARNARFAIFPGSALAKKQPSWVMVAELVETSRLWGRTAARIQPQWVEPLAGDLVRRTYEEPRWDAKRGSVVATERVTLYGLPIVAGRTVAYGAIDPTLSRELFIRRALVEGGWDRRRGDHLFMEENRRRREEAETVEHRVRRRGIVADDHKIYAFYDERIPADVVSGAHFDAWWKRARLEEPERLTFTQDVLLDPEAAAAIDPRARPNGWKQHGVTMRLSYHFEPGSEQDGVSVHVPLAALGAMDQAGFEWLVPGMRHELLTTLIRMLPKDLRHPLVPVPDVATALLERLKPRTEPLLDALRREIEALRGVRVPAGTWSLDALPAHLRMTFRVEDEDGNLLTEGYDLDALRQELRPRLQAQLAAAVPGLARSGVTTWDLGTLPREVDLPGTGGAVSAYPALVDEGATAGVRMVDTPAAQQAAMVGGTRRLLLLTVPSPAKPVLDRLGTNATLTLAGAPHGNLGAILEDAILAAIDRLTAEAGGPAWDEAGWIRLRNHVAGGLAARTGAVLDDAVKILDAARAVELALDALPADDLLQDTRLDVARQLGRLVYPGFLSATGVDRLPDVERYLRGAAHRLERVQNAAGLDRNRMIAVHDLEEAYRARLDAVGDRPRPAALREVPWLLEELRMSHFAQGLGVKGGVSSKRIRRAIAEA